MAIFRTLSNISCLAILFYINAYYLINQFLEKKRYWMYAFLSCLLFVFVIALRIKINTYAPANFYEPFITKLYKPLLGKQLLAYTFIGVTSVGILALSILYQLFSNRAAAERKTLEAINQYNQAQIQFLKAQINPHFLFNTLNNIYSLAILKSDDTPNMILKLSDLLRYVIYKGEAQKVNLEEEVLHIHKFIELFQMSHEETLNINFAIENSLVNVKIEPMILIPLVENCFKHCDFNSNPKAYIKLYLSIENNQLIFKTSNSKNDNNRQKDKTGGVGLANIHKRLAINYGFDYLLEQENTINHFSIHLTLPIQ